jgi:hypothetical protein
VNYCKIDFVWVLLFFLTSFVLAQPKPVFPDDTQDPKQAGGAELLEAVCPGHVVTGKAIECKVTCPAFTDFKGENQPWIVRRITRGHFLSPESDDAVLAMDGCESHASNFGGTSLLTRQRGRWSMLWYKSEIPTGKCHRVKLESAREILICLGDYGGQGNEYRDLYMEDLLTPSNALMSGEEGTLFTALDNSFTCGWNPQDESKPVHIWRNSIERVQFHTTPSGTFLDLSVFGHHGERDMTVAEVKACTNQQVSRPRTGIDFRPPTKPFCVDFRFDGKRMIRAGESPGAPK